MNKTTQNKEQENEHILQNTSTTKQIEELHLKYLMAALVYSVLGVAIILVSFWIIEKISPENLWKEIIEKQNNALAILAASFMIAIAIIISSAIHG